MAIGRLRPCVVFSTGYSFRLVFWTRLPEKIGKWLMIGVLLLAVPLLKPGVVFFGGIWIICVPIILLHELDSLILPAWCPLDHPLSFTFVALFMSAVPFPLALTVFWAALARKFLICIILVFVLWVAFPMCRFGWHTGFSSEECLW